MDEIRGRGTQTGQRSPRFGRARSVIVVLSVVAAATTVVASAARPTTHSAITIEATIPSVGAMRHDARAISIPVTYRCSQSSVGEVDAVIEQQHPFVRATRAMAMSCDPASLKIVLIFESRSGFHSGAARINLDISAGFADQFATKHLRSTVTVR